MFLRVLVEDTAARERLARYILHAPFSQEKITYDRSTRTIACASQKNKGNPKISPDGVTVLPALDWLAALVTHLPDKGQQLVRFYGRYSNVCQGRKKRQAGCAVQLLAEQAQEDDFETDPPVCPKCQGPMTIISFLEDPAIVKGILLHLNLWEVPERSPPPAAPARDSIYDPDFFRGLVN